MIKYICLFMEIVVIKIVGIWEWKRFRVVYIYVIMFNIWLVGFYSYKFVINIY